MTAAKMRTGSASLGTLAKVAIAFLVLIVGAFGVTMALNWKAERAKTLAERKQADLLAKFDYIKFDIDEKSVETALKTLPAKFVVAPPRPDSFLQLLNESISSKDGSFSKRSTVDHGVQLVTRKIETAGAPISPEKLEQIIGNDGVDLGNNTYKYRDRVFETTETNTRTTNKLLDLKLLDYSYVKVSPDKLMCFIRYEYKTGAFRSSETVPLYQMPDPTKPNSSKPLGYKANETVAIHNARYDLVEGIWTVKEVGISDADKSKMIDEIVANAKTVQPAKQN